MPKARAPRPRLKPPRPEALAPTAPAEASAAEAAAQIQGPCAPATPPLRRARGEAEAGPRRPRRAQPYPQARRKKVPSPPPAISPGLPPAISPILGVPWPTHLGKIKLSGLPAGLDLPCGMRVSCLTDPWGHQHLMSSTIRQGGYGKLRVAMAFVSGAQACVKEQRTQPATLRPDKHPTLSRFGRRRTSLTPALSLGIEAAAAHMFGGLYAPMQSFAAAQRHYTMMPLAVCNALQAAEPAYPPWRSTLARVAAHTTTEMLGRMHGMHMLHLDVKPNNMLVSREPPYIALADFGSVALGARQPSLMAQGTFCPPELFHHVPYIDGRADMWALGASLLAILDPPTGVLLCCHVNAGRSIEPLPTRNALRDFLATPRAMADLPDSAWGQGLSRCYRTDATLTALALEHLLVPQHARDNALQFAARLGCVEQTSWGTPLIPYVAECLTHMPPDRDFAAALQALARVRAFFQRLPHARHD